MDGRPLRKIPPWAIGAGVLACILGMLAIGPAARGQSQPPPQPPPTARPPAAGPAKAKARGRKPPAAAAPAARREPSEAFQASIRKTVEQRRRRRARRAAGAGAAGAAAGGWGPDDPRPVGAIVPWPMPPALIIRQRPQVHDEVGSLLDGLRRGG